MKKILVFGALVAMSMNSFAQDLLVESAKTALSSNNYDEAKADIDKAMSNPKSADKPKTLFIKAKVYFQIQAAKVPKFIESNPYREASSALTKLAEIDPKYSKEEVDMMLFSCAIMYNNDGVKAFTDKKNADGIMCMQNVVKIHDLNGGKRYEGKSSIEQYRGKFDTLSANATVAIGTAYLSDTNYAAAVPYLVSAKNNKITRALNTYYLLIQSYGKLNRDNDAMDVIQEARSKYPSDKNLINLDINYSKKTGKLSETIKKLEEVAGKDQDNADVQFNLAITYMQILNTADTGLFGGSKAIQAKVERALGVAIAKSPDDPEFNFNFGVLYYEKGRDANEQLNTLGDKMYDKGNKNIKEDQKKYDALKAERNSYFDKSVSYLEKVYGIFNAKSTLKEEEKSMFKNDVTALRDAYNILGKNDKYKEMKEKLITLD
jgi:hypothetical protein